MPGQTMTNSLSHEMEVDSYPATKEGLPVTKSIEGYVIIASNIHEEATEEDLSDFFLEYGDIKNLHLNLDRQTGYVKGYALIEFTKLDDARKAVNEANGEELLGRILSLDFAFIEVKKHDVETLAKADEERVRDRSPERSNLDD